MGLKTNAVIRKIINNNFESKKVVNFFPYIWLQIQPVLKRKCPLLQYTHTHTHIYTYIYLCTGICLQFHTLPCFSCPFIAHTTVITPNERYCKYQPIHAIFLSLDCLRTFLAHKTTSKVADIYAVCPYMTYQVPAVRKLLKLDSISS